MMSILCRPILLHNEFLPAITGRRKWDYQVLGHYDGITIKNNIENIAGFRSLHQLFELCARYEGGDEDNEINSNSYFTQFVFGFHFNKKKEELFWKSTLPFTYLCLIQFADWQLEQYRAYLDEGGYLEDERQSLGLKEQEEVAVQTYYTLDNSDMLLAIKCRDSRTGAKLINNLHQDIDGSHPFKIRNTYSILALKKEDINKDGDFTNPEDRIDLLELRVIESRPNSVNHLYSKLGRKTAGQEEEIKIARKALLGAEDEVIIIQEMPWNRLVKYYRDDTGFLCNSNACTRRYANAVSCKIMIPIEDRRKKQDEKEANVDKGEEEQKRKIKLCEALRKNINQVYAGNDVKSHAEKKTLMMIANALERFEYSYRAETGKFSDYSFYQTYWPFYSFVKILNTENMDPMLRNEDYFSFIKAMMLRTQNFAKPDRVYTQVADFNVRFFDIPSKLVAMYSAFVYYLKKTLDTQGKQYEFLICPGVNCKVRVKEIFERVDSKRRLFLIEIPEQQLYRPKTMLAILGHEIAHFVGTDIRERDERAENVVSIAARTILLGIKGYAAKNKILDVQRLNADIWETLEEEMKEWLEFYRGIHGQKLSEKLFDPKMLEKNGEVLKCNREFMEKYYNHSEVMYKVLLSAIEDMLSNRGFNIFSFLIHEGFEQQTAAGNLSYEQRHGYYEKKREELGACIHSMMSGNMEDSQIFSVVNVLDRILYFLKECYADLICILTLELSFQEYLSTVVESISDAKIEMDELMNTELVARIALVMAAMSDKDGLGYGQDYIWTNNEFENCEEWPKPVRELKKYGYLFGYAYLQSRVKISEVDMVQNERNIIYDNKVLAEILKYLHTCRQRFYKTEKGSGYHNVKRICRLVKENENKNCFAQMMQLLKDYEADIYNDIEGIL